MEKTCFQGGSFLDPNCVVGMSVRKQQGKCKSAFRKPASKANNWWFPVLLFTTEEQNKTKTSLERVLNAPVWMTFIVSWRRGHLHWHRMCLLLPYRFIVQLWPTWNKLIEEWNSDLFFFFPVAACPRMPAGKQVEACENENKTKLKKRRRELCFRAVRGLVSSSPALSFATIQLGEVGLQSL